MAYEGGIQLGDAFRSRREKGYSGLPTLSVTLDNGLVDRSSLDRKTDTNLSEDEHLLIRKGDIAYNMMRMWQGASGLAEKDALVSPAYVVLTAKDGTDSKYASYLFKTPRMIYLFWAYSYGLTKDRLRLYFNDFARIPVNIPAYSEQKKIARILSVWDKAIETIEKLIENSKAQKKALMQQLLTGKRRLPGFEDSWATRVLGDLGQTYGGLAGKTKDDFGHGLPFIPYINIFNNSAVDIRQLNHVIISTTENQNRAQYGDIFFTTSSETPFEVGMSSVLLDNVDQLYLNSFCFGFRLYNFEFLQPEYARFLLRSEHIRREIIVLAQGSTRFNISKKELMKIELSLPSIEEQKAITEILINAERQETNLEHQRLHLLDTKKALMQQLLTGRRCVKVETAA